ncbi:MAG TPA: hypothetical protein VE890_10810, partial [Thermoguttaceae bacterium]|nr:hypothetical protein [Thermoguttaceae bacterium]
MFLSRMNAISAVSLVLLGVTALNAEVTVSESGKRLTIANELIQFDYDLARGTYNALDRRDNSTVIAGGSLQINDLTTTMPGLDHRWTARDVSDELGTGKAVLIQCSRPGQVSLLLEITLYQGRGYLVFAAGVENSTDAPLQLKTIKPLVGASLFDGVDMSKNFRLLDGNGGGEPLQWGVKEYTAVSSGNYSHSRNNLLMTFGENASRRSLVMGGLTYHDFEKFATIHQPRKLELAADSSGRRSLACYLNLSVDQADESENGETLRLVQSSGSQRHRYLELWGDELATSVAGNGVILEADKLDSSSPYHLGFSWWHTGSDDRIQSVSVDSGPGTKRHRLIDKQKLPTWNNKAKVDPEQVELPVPKDVYASGKMRILVESDTEQPEALVSEMWLRKGTVPMLPQQLTPVNKSSRPRYRMIGSLYAEDPVGKRVDPGARYLPDDRFYLDFTTDNPFENLQQYGRSVRLAQRIDLNMYDFPTVCLWYANHRGYGGGMATNDTVGAVAEMDAIRNSGFLNYSRAAIRLVPDCYAKNNQQGWWDDEHFQKYGSTNLGDFEGGTYKPPYETSEKWGKAITQRGGIPLTYCQTGFRSEDYAHAFPEHMLFNSATAWMNPAYERPLDDEEF